MIGLARKAGKAKDGEFACEKAIRSLRAELVIFADDASENTKKKFSDMCDYREVPCLCIGTKEMLGRCIGKTERAVIAITDKGFGDSILTFIRAIGQGGR